MTAAIRRHTRLPLRAAMAVWFAMAMVGWVVVFLILNALGAI